MERVVVMGSIFLPGSVMDPFVVALQQRGATAAWSAPTFDGSIDSIGDEYAAAARRVGATTAIAHSNAGNFVPALTAQSAVSRVIFMDAVVPPLDGGSWHVVPESFRETILSSAKDGRLPPWTRWWPRDDVRALFPDESTYAHVDAVAPSIPASYLSSVVSAPSGWLAELTCSYVAFGDTYAEAVDVAVRAGWPVRRLELGHLGMLQDPAMVADVVYSL